MSTNQELAILAEIEQEGYNGAIAGLDVIFGNPYKRGHKEFVAWRKGWADGNYVVWQSVIIDKRKASTE